MKIWDEAETGDPRETPCNRLSRDKSVAFSPGGKCIVSASNSKAIRLWDPDAEVCFPNHSL